MLPAIAPARSEARTVVIELDGVSRSYRMGDELLHALDNVSASIDQGEFVAIVGPSGSGKSTLANIIGGLDTPDEGNVRVAGRDLARVRDSELSRYRNAHVGFVFQSFNLQPHATALENVMLPLVLGGVRPKARKARAAECLRVVGLGDRLRHKPTQLSGGERQRVAIARALVTSPSIIIADEPTGNLDSSRSEEIMALLEQLNAQGITLLLITHDSDVAARADRIMTIRDGRLTESNGRR